MPTDPWLVRRSPSKTARRGALVPLAAFLLAAAAPPARCAKTYSDWRPVEHADWVATPAESSAQHAIILYTGQIVDDSNIEDDMWYSYYLRVHILDQDGLAAYRTASIPSFKGAKLVRLAARTVKPDGRVIPVDSKDVLETSSKLHLFGRIREKKLAFKGTEPGDIIEYYWQYKLGLQTPPPVVFRMGSFVRQAELRWWFRQYPPGVDPMWLNAHPQYVWQAKWVLLNAVGITKAIEEVPEGAPTQVHMTLSNIAPLPDERHTPPEEDVATRALCHYIHPRLDGRGKYWDRTSRDLGSETNIFLRNRGSLDRWMEHITRRRRNIDADLDSCFALLHRDIQTTEFLPAGQSYADHKDARNAGDVLAHRGGWSYDVNRLFVAMLRSLGYDATIFWVRDSSEGVLVREWESLSQMTVSGVVVRDTASVRWLVPALPSATARTMPWQVCGCPALIECLGKTGDPWFFPTFLQTPMEPAPENVVDYAATLSSGDDGELHGRLRVSWRCPSQTFEAQNLHQQTNDEAVESLRARALQSGVQWSAHDETVSLDDSAGVAYSCSLDVRGLVEDAGSRTLIDLGAIRPDDLSLPHGRRENDIYYAHPVRYTGTVTILLPEGAHLAASVAEISESAEFCRFRESVSASQGRIVATRSLGLIHPLLPHKTIESVAGYFDKVYAKERHTLVIERAGAHD